MSKPGFSKTRHPFLLLGKIGSEWSHFDPSDRERPARVGPVYKSKAEAIADGPRYWHEEWGWGDGPATPKSETVTWLEALAGENSVKIETDGVGFVLTLTSYDDGHEVVCRGASLDEIVKRGPPETFEPEERS